MNILIRGEAVYDGTGAPPVKADILIKDGIITRVEKNPATPPEAATLPTDANGLTVVSGKAVCPGFIDIHRHPDVAVFTQPDFGKTELLQGITTTVMGNCGLSPVPGRHAFARDYFRYLEPVIGTVPDGLPLESFRAYRNGLERRVLPLNVGFLAGAGAIKTAVKGFSDAPFLPDESTRAVNLVREAFDAGALGLSFGLMYIPECYSSFDEITEMARAARLSAGGATLCFHVRGEGDSLPRSIDEVIAIAKAAGLPANISHFKSTGIKNWRNLVYRAIEKIEAARKQGLEITADFYPYDGGATTILSLIPPTVAEKSVAALAQKLSAKQGLELLRAELAREHSGWDDMAKSIGWNRIIISSAFLSEHKKFCGRNMEEIAREEGFEDPAELLAELVSREEGRVGIITLSMDQNDIDEIAALPWTCLISDSLYGAADSPHPRVNGAFPKFLKDFVRERRRLTMEEAIKKMTSMPAERMGLVKRGAILPGNAADLLVFDPARFTDNADYARPRALATGMDTVILNGRIVYNEGKFFEPNGRFVSRGK